VPFTEIQEALRDNCPEEYFTVIMRRLMINIANRICTAHDYKAIITGESVGQVASQTIMAIGCTDKVAEYPVFRPVVGMDKKEITEIARRIGTFETSIQPYYDCCTVFTPKHPRTKQVIAEVEAAEARYDFEPLILKAVGGIETKDFSLRQDEA
ncbi:MAG: tRNA 4-thiouridine(8) synthase ThiI, partial [Ruminiclostridium sp.]|nr:tRNA 4-thiouridine(8) synthase ThiI [Ruminiclostridium sp.]